MKVFDSFCRKGLDGHNSDNKEESIWEECTNDYNCDFWNPVSLKFVDLHSKFCHEINLLLAEDAVKLTAENIKKV